MSLYEKNQQSNKEENKMNIEKMKEFIKLKGELSKEGAIGFHFDSNDIHVMLSELKKYSNLEFAKRDSEDYPYEAFVNFENFKVFALIGNADVINFPQIKEQLVSDLKKQISALEGYMKEDVDLSGGEGHVTA